MLWIPLGGYARTTIHILLGGQVATDGVLLGEAVELREVAEWLAADLLVDWPGDPKPCDLEVGRIGPGVYSVGLTLNRPECYRPAYFRTKDMPESTFVVRGEFWFTVGPASGDLCYIKLVINQTWKGG